MTINVWSQNLQQTEKLLVRKGLKTQTQKSYDNSEEEYQLKYDINIIDVA